jgi:hypothetical protein
MLAIVKLNSSKMIVSTLKKRESEIKNEMDKMWLMRTLEHMANLPSPPYVIVKNEDED